MSKSESLIVTACMPGYFERIIMNKLFHLKLMQLSNNYNNNNNKDDVKGNDNNNDNDILNKWISLITL